MKKLGSLVVLSLAVIVAVLFIGANSVKATSPFGLNLTNTATNTANETNTTNTATNVVDTNALKVNNTTTVNNINDNLTKNEISKTGEFDTYIISGVAIAALAVGTVAFVKSRKLN